MTNVRNIIMLGLLAAFFAWYGVSWAFQSFYREPRQRLGSKIARYQQGIQAGKQNIAMMQQGIAQHQQLYFRSLPRIPNDARSNYSFWLLELLKFCGLESVNVNSDRPTRTNFGGLNYRFHLQGSCSSEQLSRLLFEFYYAPFLQRITALSIVPVEGREERMTLSLTIDALAIPPAYPQNPYPPTSRLPEGHFRRLIATDLEPYRIIADRNPLHAAKGGVDRADYAYLTAINQVDDRPEIWLSIRTDGGIVKAVQGESIRIGSFQGTVVDIREQDVVFRRDEMLWIVTLGDCLNQAFALPPEADLPANQGVVSK